MIIRIQVNDKPYILTESDTSSLIVGLHIHEPDDFEITLPIKPEFEYLIEYALYQILYIDDVAYIVTELEQYVDEDKEYYRIFGYNWYAHMLACSLATHALEYGYVSASDDPVIKLIKRSVDDFARLKRVVEVDPAYIEKGLNFNILKKGKFVMEWLYDQCKISGAICRFNGPYLVIKHADEVRIASHYLHILKEKKEIDTNAYIELNNKNYIISRSVNNNSWASPIKYSITTPDRYNLYISRSSSDLYYISQMLGYYFDAWDIATGKKLRVVASETSSPYANNYDEGTVHYTYIMMCFERIYGESESVYEYTQGVRIKVKNLISPIFEDVINKLKKYTVVKWTDNGGMLCWVTQTDYDIVKVDNYTYELPNIRRAFGYFDSSINLAGEFSGILIDKQSAKQAGSFFPDYFTVAEPFKLLDAYNRLPYRLFSENAWRSEYELSEDEYEDIPIGCRILSSYDDIDSVICTDKVKTYENGEIHYDVTIKSSVEVERPKQKQ